MNQSTETRQFLVLGAVLAVVAAMLASAITIGVVKYAPEMAAPDEQLFDGPQALELASLGVDKLEVQRVYPMGGEPAFQLKVHRTGKVTAYRGFYPDTVNMEIEIAPEGQARVEYREDDLQEINEDRLRIAGEFFLVKGAEIARKVRAFDGQVLNKGSLAKTSAISK